MNTKDNANKNNKKNNPKLGSPNARSEISQVRNNRQQQQQSISKPNQTSQEKLNSKKLASSEMNGHKKSLSEDIKLVNTADKTIQNLAADQTSRQENSFLQQADLNVDDRRNKNEMIIQNLEFDEKAIISEQIVEQNSHQVSLNIFRVESENEAANIKPVQTADPVLKNNLTIPLNLEKSAEKSLETSQLKNDDTTKNKKKSSRKPSEELQIKSPEKFLPKGKTITLEQRIKNQDKILVYPLLILPANSPVKYVWDIIILIFVIYSSFLSPIDIAFDFSGAVESAYKVINNITLAVFIVDIILNFRTTYFTATSDEIIDGRMIMWHYLRSTSFILDLLSTLPISEIADLFKENDSSGSNNNYLIWFKQIKIIRILRLFKISKFLQSESAKTIYQIGKIFLIFILIYHWLTCIWFLMAKLDYNPGVSTDENTWLPSNIRSIGYDDNQLAGKTIPQDYWVNIFYEEYSKFQVYSHTVYSLIILTLGNDIAPTNNTLTVFAILMCVLGSFLTAIFFGEVAVLVAQLNAEQSNYQQKLDKLEYKLKHNNIPQQLKTKVLEYFDFCWEKKAMGEDSNDFQLLSIPLQQEIHTHTHSRIIKNVPIFKHLDEKQIVWIIRRLKSDIFLPDDFIIKQNEIGNEMYLITEGLVEIAVKNMDNQTNDHNNDKKENVFTFTKEKGDYFGEIALIIDSKRTADVKAIDFTVCEILDRATYEGLQREFPEIQSKLKQGLQSYKSQQKPRIINTLKKKLFYNVDKSEIDRIVEVYMEDIFIDTYQLILRPKYCSQALYCVLIGKVSVLQDTPENKQLLRKLKKQNDVLKTNYQSLNKNYVSLDENLDDLNDDTEDIEKVLGQNVLNTGDFFGVPDIEPQYTSIVKEFYLTTTGCQIGFISQNSFKRMKEKDPILYRNIQEDLAQNFQLIKQSSYIQVDDNSSTGNRMDQAQIENILEENQINQKMENFQKNLQQQIESFQLMNDQLNILIRKRKMGKDRQVFFANIQEQAIEESLDQDKSLENKIIKRKQSVQP